MLIQIIYAVLVVVWIYLVWMLWRTEPKLAERRRKTLKKFLWAAGISNLAYWANILLMTRIFPPSSEGADTVYLFIALFLFILLAIATIGGLVIFLTGRRKTTSAGERGDSALETLKNRYARGEINKEEYEEKKKDLI